MKCALLFNADYFEVIYGTPIQECLFHVLLSNHTFHYSTKVFIGDLTLYQNSYQRIQKGDGYTYEFDLELFSTLLASMVCPEANIWKNITKKSIEAIKENNVYVICFESIELYMADYLNEMMKKQEFYIGSLEIYDAVLAHWILFTDSLIPMYRIKNNDIYLFYDKFNEEEIEKETIIWLKKIGFQSVNTEELKGKYTIFDQYHDFEHSKRIAEWKAKGSSMLAFIAESTLSDPAPDIGDRVWAIIDTFYHAQTNEQYA